jgi:hypothetical protein
VGIYEARDTVGKAAFLRVFHDRNVDHFESEDGLEDSANHSGALIPLWHQYSVLRCISPLIGRDL